MYGSGSSGKRLAAAAHSEDHDGVVRLPAGPRFGRIHRSFPFRDDLIAEYVVLIRSRFGGLSPEQGSPPSGIFG